MKGHERKRLSRALTELSSAPYAKADCAQQNPEGRLEAIQDYRDGKSETATCLPASPAFIQERQAQAPYGEVRRGSQDRRSSDQVEHAVRVSRSRSSASSQRAFSETPVSTQCARREFCDVRSTS